MACCHARQTKNRARRPFILSSSYKDNNNNNCSQLRVAPICQVQEGVRYADKKCRKLRMGAKPSSPTLSFAKNMLRLCRLLIAKREMKARGHAPRSNASRRIRRLQRKLRRSLPDGHSPEEVDLYIFISICPIFESISITKRVSTPWV